MTRHSRSTDQLESFVTAMRPGTPRLGASPGGWIPSPRRSNGGFVLVIALVLSAIMAVFVFASASTVLSSQRIAHNTELQNSAEQWAFNAAVVGFDDQASINRAVELAANEGVANWPQPPVTLNGFDGTVDVEITAKRRPILGVSLNALDRYLVTVTSEVEHNGVTRRVSLGYTDLGPVQNR